MNLFEAGPQETESILVRSEDYDIGHSSYVKMVAEACRLRLVTRNDPNDVVRVGLANLEQLSNVCKLGLQALALRTAEALRVIHCEHEEPIWGVSLGRSKDILVPEGPGWAISDFGKEEISGDGEGCV